MPTFASPSPSVAPSQKLPDDLARKLQSYRESIDRLSVLQERIDREPLEYRQIQAATKAPVLLSDRAASIHGAVYAIDAGTAYP